MTPGPTLIYSCSTCEKNIAYHTINSGNNIGARYWTDGKRDAPMLPEEPWLIKCPHCDALIWVDELTQVGEIDHWYSEGSDADEFADVQSAITPSLMDYAYFNMAAISDPQKERYVRLQTWWAFNDCRRESQELPLSSIEIENLHAFINLLDENEENDRLMKAEVYRELGEFTVAEKLLAMPFGDELKQAAELIRNLNNKRITSVTEIIFE
jgi:hypothetical protein